MFKQLTLLSVIALTTLSLSACGLSKHKSSYSDHPSSKVVKHHKKKHSKKKASNSSSSVQTRQQQNGRQNQQHSQSVQNNQQQTQSSSTKDDTENLHLFYSDKANNGHGGLIAVYSHGDDPQTNQRAEQYGNSIAQNGGSGDYHYN